MLILFFLISKNILFINTYVYYYFRLYQSALISRSFKCQISFFVICGTYFYLFHFRSQCSVLCILPRFVFVHPLPLHLLLCLFGLPSAALQSVVASILHISIFCPLFSVIVFDISIDVF